MAKALIPGHEPAIALYRRNGFVAADKAGELLSDGMTRELVMTAFRRPVSTPEGISPKHCLKASAHRRERAFPLPVAVFGRGDIADADLLAATACRVITLGVPPR